MNIYNNNKSNTKKTVYLCDYCGRKGHLQNFCIKKKNDIIQDLTLDLNNISVDDDNSDDNDSPRENVISRLHTIKNSKTREDLKIEKIMDFYNNVDNNSNSRYMSVEMEMSVSSGFYIRQFCVDFGEYIGYPCIAMDIHRICIE